jgi:hypothetical protein
MDFDEYNDRQTRGAYLPRRRSLQLEPGYDPDFKECRIRAKEAHSVITTMVAYDHVAQYEEELHQILKTHAVYVRSTRDTTNQKTKKKEPRRYGRVKSVRDIRNFAQGHYPALLFALPPEIPEDEVYLLIEAEFPEDAPWTVKGAARSSTRVGLPRAILRWISGVMSC